MRPCVTLLTDFGTRDGFVGAMKGVLASRSPSVSIHDISHEIEPGDVRAGAYALATAAPWFPEGTVHVAVVDPGVGTARAALVLAHGGQFFVGPDNGLLSLAAPEPDETVRLDRPELFLQPVSATFHGRDVFAPIAARLANGASPGELGSAVDDMVRLVVPPVAHVAGRVVGQVAHVDRFGNLMTNIPATELGDRSHQCTVRIGRAAIRGVARTYGDGAPNELVAVINGGRYLEIAVCGRSAATVLGQEAYVGAPVIVEFDR